MSLTSRSPRSHATHPLGRELLPIVLGSLGILVRLGVPATADEATPMKKAFEMWGWSRGHVTLDPHTAGWPSFSFYLHLLVQHLQFAVGRWSGAFTDRNDYFVAAWPDLASIEPVARGISMVAAALVIWSGTRLAGRLAGLPGALLTGLLLVFSPLLVQYSRLITPDILVALFTALAVTSIVAIQERGRVSDDVWTAIWIGLGVSSKYTPALLLPAVFVAHQMRADQGGVPGRAAWRSPRPWWTVVGALGVFAVTSPYLLLDAGTAARDWGIQWRHLTHAHFGQERQGPLFYVGVLGRALGWPGLAVCVGGLSWAAVKSRGPWRVVAACVAPFALGLSVLATQFPRYVLPLLMPLAVGASGLLRALDQEPRLGRSAKVGLAALTLLATSIPPAFETLSHRGGSMEPTPGALAERYLRQAAGDAELLIAAEAGTVPRQSAQKYRGLDRGFLDRLTALQRSRLRKGGSYRVDDIPMSTVAPEQTAPYYDLRHYVRYDFIVVSQTVRGRYLADPARFPAQARFYQDLDHYGSLAWRTGSDPADPTEIRGYRLLPAGAAALERDRGPLRLGDLATAPLDPTTFVDFVHEVARAAMIKRDWPRAADYFDLLLEARAIAGFSDEESAALARLVAALRARADSSSRAAPSGRLRDRAIEQDAQ